MVTLASFIPVTTPEFQLLNLLWMESRIFYIHILKLLKSLLTLVDGLV